VFVDGEGATFVSADSLLQGNNRWAYVRPDKIRLIQSGDTLTFAKVDPPKFQTDVAGVYHSDEVGADYQFYFNKHVLMLKVGHWPAKVLKPAFKDAYSDEDGVLYEFVRPKKGQIQRVIVSVARAENMQFTRIRN